MLVADGGQVVLKKGYGLANMEWNIPNTADTKFRLGSITKQFTATLIMQLVEQGKIDLKAPVTRYLPNYPGGRVIKSPFISF
ncbi:MAG: beta-lactamase family protein [Acidobacteria bacterium]|nr:beta-lactamase family protein [Acidobacteriota bacterium]